MKLQRTKCKLCRHHSGAILNICNKHGTKNTMYLICDEFNDKRTPEDIKEDNALQKILSGS